MLHNRTATLLAICKSTGLQFTIHNFFFNPVSER